MAQGSTARAWARGGTIFAATVLLLVGVYQILLGIAAIAKNNFFVVGPNYAYTVNTTAWGWIHLGIGVVAVLAGFFLFTGTMWARIAGIAMASISAIANFFFLPYYPLWSLLIIAIDVFAIWAIANMNRPDLATISESEYAMARGDYTQTGERWPANPPTGRHYAEPAKEGVSREQAQREASEAMARSGGQGQPGGGQSGMGSAGQGPPTMPRDTQGPPA
jgi:hypothetical protein